MQQVLSKSCDIGFCGPEQILYIYNQGRSDMPTLFAQLTQTDGSFLVGRTLDKNFKWNSLKGKTIIGGRPGGVPEMALEYVLKKHNLKPFKDVNVITNLDFTATTSAFKTGTGDYAALFEPSASILQKNKGGYIVDSIGKNIGSVPYTCYFATKSYIDKNPDVIQKFTNAIYKGQLWISKHSDKEIAESIKSFFPGSDVKILTSVIKNYKSINAFSKNPKINSKDLNKLIDIIKSYKSDLIEKTPNFNEIGTNKFAEKSIHK